MAFNFDDITVSATEEYTPVLKDICSYYINRFNLIYYYLMFNHKTYATYGNNNMQTIEIKDNPITDDFFLYSDHIIVINSPELLDTFMECLMQIKQSCNKIIEQMPSNITFTGITVTDDLLRLIPHNIGTVSFNNCTFKTNITEDNLNCNIKTLTLDACKGIQTLNLSNSHIDYINIGNCEDIVSIEYVQPKMMMTCFRLSNNLRLKDLKLIVQHCNYIDICYCEWLTNLDINIWSCKSIDITYGVFNSLKWLPTYVSQVSLSHIRFTSLAALDVKEDAAIMYKLILQKCTINNDLLDIQKFMDIINDIHLHKSISLINIIGYQLEAIDNIAFVKRYPYIEYMIHPGIEHKTQYFLKPIYGKPLQFKHFSICPIYNEVVKSEPASDYYIIATKHHMEAIPGEGSFAATSFEIGRYTMEECIWQNKPECQYKYDAIINLPLSDQSAFI